MAIASLAPKKSALITSWTLRIIVALFFLSFGIMKVTAQPFMVAEFDTVGLGQWLRLFTGSLEIVGAVALVVPRTSIVGALLLLVVDLGAMVATITVLHADWIHCIVVAALLIAIIYLQRTSLGRLAGHKNFASTSTTAI